MFDLLAIVAAIVFVMLAMRLRTLLAMPFPVQRARLIEGDWAERFAADDVVGKADAELRALGFQGPQWLSILTQPAESGNVRAASCWRHADGTLVFLLPTFLVETPNRGIVYFATRLADGRTLVSQPSDPYFALTADSIEPARCLPPMVMADCCVAHRGFVAEHGQAADDAIDPRTMVDIVGDWMNRRRARLLQSGALGADRQGVARPRLGFALRALWHSGARQKWPMNVEPIPVSRLVRIAMASARIRERSPTPAMQWLLFAFSVLLFFALGAFVFGTEVASILLLAIAVHESGHFLAMRAFGYRNVQMLALPLVGGVTFGQELHPRAVHRAWMAMMGPLPGILIGWGLFVLAWVLRDAGLLLHAAWVFLVINYLNLAPVPPLDGGKIVQAMWPPRRYGMRIGFLLIACTAGAALAAAFGWIALALIVSLQITQVVPLLQNRRAIRHLIAEGVRPDGASHEQKLHAALAALERVLGPTVRAQARINQAEDIVRSLDVVPMSVRQRVLLLIVYAILLVIPLVMLALTLRSI